VDRTQRNPWSAFLGEAKANRLYVAYAMKARFTRHNPILSGLEIMAIAAAVAAAGYGLGLLFLSP
jgi:rubrerythrin